MKQISLCLILSLLLVSQAILAAESQRRLDPNQIINNAPILSLEEDSINSFETEVFVNLEGITFGFRIAAKAPDRYALTVFDPKDNTPIMVARGNKVLFYDPTADELILFDGKCEFRMEITKPDVNDVEAGINTFSLGFGFNTKFDPNKPVEQHPVYINLRSIMQAAPKSPKMKRINKEHYTLTSFTKGGGRIIAQVKLTNEMPIISSVEMYTADDPAKTPSTIIKEIKINDNIPEQVLNFPMKKLRDSDLMVAKLDKGEAGAYQGLAVFYKAIFARLIVSSGVIDNIEAGKYEKLFKQTIDWQRVKERDKKVSKELKLIFQP